MAILMSKIVKVFLSMYLAVLLIRNYLMFVYLMKQPRDRFMRHKQRPQKPKANQIVHIAPWGMTPTKAKYGALAKWTLIMYRLGVKGAQQTLKIAKCCARLTIEQRAIGK